jgi:hypothetical protein
LQKLIKPTLATKPAQKELRAAKADASVAKAAGNEVSAVSVAVTTVLEQAAVLKILRPTERLNLN